MQINVELKYTSHIYLGEFEYFIILRILEEGFWEDSPTKIPLGVESWDGCHYSSTK